MSVRKEAVVPGEHAELIKSLRRRPIIDPETGGEEAVLDTAAVERLLPHRPPLRYVDGILRVDRQAKAIVAYRDLSADDPVFAGHFPEVPVYPGTFQLESIGQAATALCWFLNNDRLDVPMDATPPPVRALKIRHAEFRRPVGPGVRALLVSGVLDSDDFGAIVIGQFMVDGKITAFSIGDLHFPE